MSSDRIIERRSDRELLPRAELQVGRMPVTITRRAATVPILSRAVHTIQPGQDRPGHSRVHMALRLNGPRKLEDGSRPRSSVGDASASK